MLNLIGIHGLYGTGKDTIAQIIHEEFGHVIRHFAEPVYQCLWNLNPHILVSAGEYRQLQEIVRDRGWDYAKSIPEVRRGLQVTGTENGRDIHGSNCWVIYTDDLWFKEHMKRGSSPTWVYADVRFENELRWIRGCHGGSIKVIGPQRRVGGDVTKQHSSEAGLPDHLFDAIINNDRTLDDLRVKVINAMEHLNSPDYHQLRTF